MKSVRSRVVGFASAVALFGLVAPSWAAPVVDFTLTRDDGSNPVSTWSQSPTGTGPGPVYNFDYDVSSTGWDFEWTVSADPDPIVTSNLVVTNVSAVPQTFTSLVVLPITAIPGATLIGGSISGSVTDGNGGGTGASLDTVAGSALYTALIDGVVADTLYAHPFSATVVGNFQSTDIPDADFGTPIPSQAGPAALTDIAIQLKFKLSPGDSASFTSVFVVEPVPEPTAITLLGLGGLALLARRRRA
jgi:hypothetical protein